MQSASHQRKLGEKKDKCHDDVRLDGCEAYRGFSKDWRMRNGLSWA